MKTTTPRPPQGPPPPGADCFPLPALQPVPLSRFPDGGQALDLVSAGLLPNGRILAFGQDGTVYQFPERGERLADTLLDTLAPVAA